MCKCIPLTFLRAKLGLSLSPPPQPTNLAILFVFREIISTGADKLKYFVNFIDKSNSILSCAFKGSERYWFTQIGVCRPISWKMVCFLIKNCIDQKFLNTGCSKTLCYCCLGQNKKNTNSFEGLLDFPSVQEFFNGNSYKRSIKTVII